MPHFRFLLDENMSHAVIDALHRLEPSIQITAVGKDDAPSLSTTDPELLVWIAERNYLLVTRNRRSMPQHLQEHLRAGLHVPGILVVTRRMSIGDIARSLHLLWEAGLPHEFQDRIVYLPID